MNLQKISFAFTWGVPFLLAFTSSSTGWAQSSEQLYLPAVVQVESVGQTGQGGSRGGASREMVSGDHESLPAATESEGSSSSGDLLPPRQGEESSSFVPDGMLTVSKGGVSTMLGSLAIVVGLFLLMAWFAKRNMPRSHRWLSSDVVEVLGRAPLSGKQTMHVIRLGPKVLLVAVTPHGATTLTEVTDPHEVERLLTLCRHESGNSVSASFRDVLTQFEREPVEGFLEPTSGFGARA